MEEKSANNRSTANKWINFDILTLNNTCVTTNFALLLGEKDVLENKECC